MKASRDPSWTRAAALFAAVAVVSGAWTYHAAMAKEEKAVEGFPVVLRRDITLWSDGTRLSGVLLYPKDREEGGKLPAIVLCNGWGGTKAFLIQSGIAPRFAAAGYVVIVYDYRGWGDSDSRLVVRGEMPKPDKDGSVTVKAQAIRELVDPVDQQEDIETAVSYVYGEPMVDTGRIGIWGTSFGGGHVIYRAAHDSRIACVVAQVGSMPDDWTKRYPDGLKAVYKGQAARARGDVDPVPQGGGSPGGLTGTPYGERIALFNPSQYADRVNVPTLLIDAEKEHYFKIQENAGRVHEILKKNGVPTEYHVLQGIGHYAVYSGQPLDDVMKLEIAWFDKYLKEKRWQPLASMPQERFEHACALVGDALYVFGGYGQGVKSSNHVQAFDLARNEWRRLRDMPSAITHVNTAVDGRTVWIAGGFKDGYPGKAIDEVWKYDVDKDAFVAAPSLPEPRAGGGLALVGRRLHYFGGLKQDRDTDAADHWVLDLDATGSPAKWKSAADMPAPRNQFGTVTHQGKIYAIGGQFHHDSTSGKPALDQARVDIYDPATDSWSSGPELPIPHSHSENSTFLHKGRLFVIGGRSVNRVEAAIWVLSAEGKWSRFGTLPVPLIGPAARIIAGRLVVAGGAPRGYDPQSRVWALKLSL